MRLSQLHAWRHETELRGLQPRFDAYWAVNSNRPDGTDAERENYYRQVVAPHEDAFLADFPQSVPEKTAWEVILREENWRSVLRNWRHDGQQIFEFAPDLLAMLADTDVNELPVQNLRMPYDTFYVALAPGHFLPDYNRDWVVDGFYVTAEMCLVDSLRLRPRPPNELIAEQRKQWSDLERIPGALESLRKGNSGSFTSFDSYIAKLLADNAAAQQLYDRYLLDPDAVMDEIAAKVDIRGSGEWRSYLMFTVDFTFRRRDHAPVSLSLTDLLEQPTLRAHYDFVSHRNTVTDGIERGRRSGIPMDTFREDDGHPDDLRNVISDPTVLEQVTRLVFNLVCYLNYPERDQEKRLSDPRIHEKVRRAKGKARKMAEARAHQDGCRWINFCGYRTSFEKRTTLGGTVVGHWRRGHWRNQRFGKALAESRLMWIRPTMVGADKDIVDSRPTVYGTSQSRPPGL
ncbi:hypothetical protein GGR16_000049 [Chelatococcus caeni]|uniref:Uncharacterized protein n=1 Tax=Chelatococcus caeni TaxID=1348468 RepID=A0A840BQZ8_9HYPH|nr:hypothetical protein [Chelatococcus caeni]MBB4015043.1 hypothetical protein [Chelatococcus caeni]